MFIMYFQSHIMVFHLKPQNILSVDLQSDLQDGLRLVLLTHFSFPLPCVFWSLSWLKVLHHMVSTWAIKVLTKFVCIM